MPARPGLSRPGLLGPGPGRDLLAGAALLGLLLLPLLMAGPGLRDFLVYVVAYGLLAMSLNLLVGLTGLVSFGHAAFFASGAYIFGLLMQSGATSIPVAALAAVGGTALFALLVGLICVRLRDIYFSFITLAFQMFLHSVILTWVGLTGGDQGLRGGIPRPPFWGIDLARPRVLYVACVALLMLCLLVLRQVWRSPFGFTLRMVRDNPARATFLGVDILRARLVAFVLAGSIAAVGGIVLALFVSGAYPEFGFWTTSGEAIFMIMLGGTELFLGPLVGALLLQALNHFVVAITEYNGLVLGCTVLLITLGLRRGLADFAADALSRLWRPHPASPAAAPTAAPGSAATVAPAAALDAPGAPGIASGHPTGSPAFAARASRAPAPCTPGADQPVATPAFDTPAFDASDPGLPAPADLPPPVAAAPATPRPAERGLA